jgi:hypothetical protein
VYIYIETAAPIYIQKTEQNIYICCRFNIIYIYDEQTVTGLGKVKKNAIFLNLFTAFSSSKRKFVVCPFFDKETNGSYLFANGLNGPNRLAPLELGDEDIQKQDHKIEKAMRTLKR